MPVRPLPVLGVVFALLLPISAARAADVDCMTQPLGPIDTWSIVVNGDLEQANTDAEGRVAAGRNVTLTNPPVPGPRRWARNRNRTPRRWAGP